MTIGPILIVDDDPLLVDVISAALTLNGCHNSVARDGQEALATILRARPSLVLLDLHMPVLDGEGVLRELAARRVRLPIVLMTASDDGEDVATKHSVAGFLKKPFDLPLLLAAIAACEPIAD